MGHRHLKLSADWRIPLILIGESIMELTAQRLKTYMIKRYKAIVSDAKNIDRQELKRFLIYDL